MTEFTCLRLLKELGVCTVPLNKDKLCDHTCATFSAAHCKDENVDIVDIQVLLSPFFSQATLAHLFNNDITESLALNLELNVVQSCFFILINKIRACAQVFQCLTNLFLAREFDILVLATELILVLHFNRGSHFSLRLPSA